jgi:predicted RNA-binding protein with PUA-like domain
MKYWILKSEPEVYSFENLLKDKKTCWDGVRNYQARNNLRAMEVGDLCLIYHSQGPKSLVGIAKVVKPAYKDPKSDEDWSAVDIAPVKPLNTEVTLEQLKKDALLKEISLVKQSRLSVCPLDAKHFAKILKLAGSELS